MKNYKAILIGNGTMGRRHRTRFEECGVRFDDVLDVEADQRIGSPEWSNLKNGNVESPDFAVIASPASTHFKYAKFFLERKIPVLVEKPLAASAAEARELVRLAESSETLLFVAQSECYNPIFLNFRKHLLVDLKRATSVGAGKPLKVKLEFRREHGFSERCRDVDVSLDLLIHDISLFLNLFDARDVTIVEDDRREDRAHMILKVVGGMYAGVVADFVADRNSPRDVRTISAVFDRNGDESGFDYSVSLVRYSEGGLVAHIPDSLDNEHHFFLKLLGGACGTWASRALSNAANAVVLASGEKP